MMAILAICGCDGMAHKTQPFHNMSGLLLVEYDGLYGPRLVLQECRSTPCTAVELDQAQSCRPIASTEIQERLERLLRGNIPGGEAFPSEESFVEPWKALALTFSGRRRDAPDGVYVSPHGHRCEIEVREIRSAAYLNLLETAGPAVSPSSPPPPRPASAAGP